MSMLDALTGSPAARGPNGDEIWLSVLRLHEDFPDHPPGVSPVAFAITALRNLFFSDVGFQGF